MGIQKWKLDLSRHCLITEMRRQQERAVSLALKGREDREVLERAEILKRILETVDLKSLRGLYAELQGNHEQEVVLLMEEEKVFLCFSGRVLPLL